MRSSGNKAFAIGQDIMEKCMLNALSEGFESLNLCAVALKTSPNRARSDIVIGTPSAAASLFQYSVPTPSNLNPISAAIAQSNSGLLSKSVAN
jgi:hypothetical protein